MKYAKWVKNNKGLELFFTKTNKIVFIYFLENLKIALIESMFVL